MINFNWEVGIGDVVTILAVLFSGLKIYGKQRVTEFKVNELWRWYKNAIGRSFTESEDGES